MTVIVDGLSFIDPTSNSASSMFRATSNNTALIMRNCMFDGYAQPNRVPPPPVITGPRAPAQAVAAGYTTRVGGFEANSPTLVSLDTSGATIAPFYAYNDDIGGGTVSAGNYSIGPNGLTLTKVNGVVNGQTVNYGFGFMSLCSNSNYAKSTPTNHAANTGWGVGYQFGYFEASMVLDWSITNANYFPTFWMDGNIGNGAAGFLEVDIFELNSAQQTAGANGTSGANQFSNFLIWGLPGVANGGVTYAVSARGNPPENQIVKSPTASNVFGFLWTPTGCTWYINNVASVTLPMNDATVLWTTDAGQQSNFAGNSKLNIPTPGQFLGLQFGTGTDGRWPCTWNWIRVWQ